MKTPLKHRRSFEEMSIQNAYPRRRFDMKQRFLIVITALVALILGMSGSIVDAQQGSLLGDLRQLVDKEDEAFLLTEIKRVRPYYAIRQLARFQQMQDRVGGGFCGCLPAQLINTDEIPLPVDDVGVVETAVYLARLRQANLGALTEFGFPVASPSSPFAGIPSVERSPSLAVTIDTSVPTVFLDALSDGEITMAEAREIAQLPANREILSFICDRCEGAEAQVSEQTLAYMIWKSGSRDPLDRLWRWVNPMNDFGYADLAAHARRYRELVETFDSRQYEIADVALARVAPFLPSGTEMSVHLAFMPGCLTGDWMTPAMSGTDVIWINAGWQDVAGRISAAVYRRYLMEQSGGSKGTQPWGDHPRAALADEGLATLHELIVFTSLEGSIDFASNPSTSIDKIPRYREGADLINTYVVEVIAESHGGSTLALSALGRDQRGALIALGRHLAGLVAERDGHQAVTALLKKGSLGFFQRALEIKSKDGDELFDQEVAFAIDDLSARLDR